MHKKVLFRCSLVLILIAINAVGFIQENSTKTVSSLLFSSEKNLVLKPDYLEIKNFTQDQYAWADSLLNEMTLEEKVGQLFMIPTYSNKSESHYLDIENKIKKYHVGGLIFFQGNAPTQARLTNRYQNLSRVSLMIGMDAEWGLGMRLKNTISYPKQITLGAIQDNQLIEEMGEDIGKQLKRLGVQVNFAPVADVNTNPNNPVIGYRSFGESETLVAEKSMAYARGLRKAGVIAVAKHFPGHGDTGTDSHVAMPVLSHNRNRLSKIELAPFRKLINDGIAGVMTGHLFVPSLDNVPNKAASISSKIINDLLRKELGFSGLVFTDALNMRGITGQFGPGGADLAAYKAGNDVLLQTANLGAGYNKILSALKSGELDVNDLNNRVHKILRYKYEVGLEHKPYINTSGLMADLNNAHSEEIIGNLFKNAVTVVRTEPDVFPFVQLDTLTVATVAVNAPENNAFQNEVNSFGKVVNYTLTRKPSSKNDWSYILNQAFSYDVMVVSVHGMTNRSSRNYGVSATTISMIRELSKKTKVVVVGFGNPYGLKLFDEFPNVICGYESNSYAYRAVAQILFGAGSASGHLPVTASEKSQLNFGKNSASVGRITEDLPESVGMSSEKLDEIDDVVANAISQRAFPGAQVLVARRGKVVYHKAFGTFRYGNTEKVTKNTIYDLASLTKVSATLQAAMMLNEKGLLNLNLKASDYLPELIGTNKENMVIGEILFHQAGLKSFQAFWTHTKSKSGAFNGDFYQFSKPEENLMVANNLYIKPSIRDSVWKWLQQSDYTTRRKNSAGEFRYLYSDLGLIMVQRIIEEVTNQPLDEFLDQNLYEPLGMTHTLFNPLKRYNKSDIAPTEYDGIFRERQIWGTVHDPNAALLGGVAGHAGLFSNAWDLAKLFQMNLQNGVYGGRRYLYPETVQHFATNYTARSHRGIGWNKPVEGRELSSIANTASPNTYGHTGFTGTVVWVDPDRQLIFSMLANRVYPKSNNRKLMQLGVRRKIHEIINSSIDYF